jgi:endo-1,4-beta-xylanase
MARELNLPAAFRSGRLRRWLAGLLAVACTVAVATLEPAQPGSDTATRGTNDAARTAWGGAGAQAAAAPDVTLRTLAAARGLGIGTAVLPTALGNEAGYRDKVAYEFNSVTPEDQKWPRLEPVRGQYDWSGLDAIVDFAGQHNQMVRGHTLVWHSAVPAWLQDGDFSTAEVRSILQQFITETVSRYAGRIQVWDVVNEAFNDDGTLRQDSFWYQRLGAGYIADAFRWAHAADPDARLYINDYNIERINSKSTALYDYVRDLRAEGVPIHGVGFQNHITINNDLASFTDNLQRFANLGLDVAVTEMDVRMQSPTTANLALQAQRYDTALRGCLAVVRCVSFTVWGFTDARSSVPVWAPGWGWATLMDTELRPKPAYETVHTTLGNRNFTSTAVAAHSGKCLEVPNGSTQSWLQLQQRTCGSGAQNQQFEFERVASGTLGTGVYLVRNRASGLCLQVRDGSTADGTPIVQVPCIATANSQRFELQRVTGLGSDRDFQLVATHSRRCVDVVAMSTANGAKIQQWSCDDTTPVSDRNQIFRLSNAAGGHP